MSQDASVWLPKVGKVVMANDEICTMAADAKCAGVVTDITDDYVPRLQVKSSGLHPAIVCNPTGDLSVTMGDYLVNHDGRLRLGTTAEAESRAVCAHAYETHTASTGVNGEIVLPQRHERS
jgi:hypothetical protein